MKFKGLKLTLKDSNDWHLITESLFQSGVAYESFTDFPQEILLINAQKIPESVSKYGSVENVEVCVSYVVATLNEDASTDYNSLLENVTPVEHTEDIERALAVFSELTYGNNPPVLIKSVTATNEDDEKTWNKQLIIKTDAILTFNDWLFN